MSVIIKESELPQELTAEQVVEAAYSAELAEVASKLQRSLPVLIEADKDLAPWLYLNIRNRLRAVNIQCLYLDGRPRQEEQQGPMPMGMMGTMIAQLREAVRGGTALQRRIVVLPHLDLLTTSQGGLTSEAREVIPLLYENPELVWVGFKDPSFPLPQVIENLFPHRVSLLGIARNRLRYLVTRKESRKFGREFNPWSLYKHVSGVNAVRLRKLLSTLEGEDYPANAAKVYRQLRQATLGGTLEVPNISFDKDIGGYVKVKEQLRNEVLNLLARKDALTNEEQIRSIEELIPKGMIFWGPPGTGKTLFAKAMASEIGAAITVVSGPELKSKWVGESLPWDEEVFVVLNGEARRMPIGQLVDEHRDEDVVETWTVTDNGKAALAPVTGFLRHEGPDYIDVLVTQTGRQVRVTGGHSLFVQRDGRLAEVFAEEVVPNETRVAVPLRLAAPQTVSRLNLVELLGDREDVRVQGYDAVLPEAVGRVGAARAEASLGVAVKRLQGTGHRPPLTLAGFRGLLREANIESDLEGVSLYCWHRNKSMPATLPLTEEWGEFLGLWVAEGSYTRQGVRLSHHKDEVEHAEALYRRLFGHVTRYAKEGDGVDLYINSTLLFHLMKDGLGMTDGAAEKRVPPIIFLAPLPVVAAFLRGYFSGDGTFSGKYIEATTVNRGLANDVLTLLQYFGIAARCSRKRERTGSTSHRVRFMWKEFLRRFVEQIGFNDARRTGEVRDYVENMTFRRYLQTPEPHISNDVLWDLVVQKRREPYRRQHVYDLSVPATERFLAGFGNVLVHNSEENLRRIFHQARQCAPSIIVFDELDSFASARGTYTGSGVEHSMVNQLLTEMDGFHREEMVFIVGTTNFVEILDPALLRPGRFEFHLHIPYPDTEARREIIKIYDKKMALHLSEEALEFGVKRTGSGFLTAQGTPFSGDHINAMCRSVARLRLRDARSDETTPQDIERALTEYEDKLNLTAREEKLLATHESGHAICALFCPHHPLIERITIRSETSWAPAYVRFKEDDSRRIGLTYNQMWDDLCVLYGGIEAERLLMEDVSTGAAGSDLERATRLAHFMVEVCGMGNNEVINLRQFRSLENGERLNNMSEEQLAALDRQVNDLICRARQRTATILRENRKLLETLRDMLIEKKTIEASTLKNMVPGSPAAESADGAADGAGKAPAREEKKSRKTKAENA
jgi:ATP-dependent Zn protease